MATGWVDTLSARGGAWSLYRSGTVWARAVTHTWRWPVINLSTRPLLSLWCTGRIEVARLFSHILENKKSEGLIYFLFYSCRILEDGDIMKTAKEDGEMRGVTVNRFIEGKVVTFVNWAACFFFLLLTYFGPWTTLRLFLYICINWNHRISS